MKDVEERALSFCTNKPFFWKRHRNDTLPALPPDQIQAFHHHLNSIKPPIQFTIKEESQSLSLSLWAFCCWGSSLTCPCQAVVSSIVWLVWLISPNFFDSCLIIRYLPPLYMISRHPHDTCWHTHPLLMSRSSISFVTLNKNYGLKPPVPYWSWCSGISPLTLSSDHTPMNLYDTYYITNSTVPCGSCLKTWIHSPKRPTVW